MHRRTHKGQSYRCTLCPFEAASRSLLTSHSAKHSGSKKFACLSCPMSFAYKSQLNKHRRKEHIIAASNRLKGEKIECPHCPRGFKYLKSFQRHVLDHDGENNKELKVKIKLPAKKTERRVTRASIKSGGEEQERELLAHDGLRCNECGKQFTRPTWLERHKSNHHHETEEDPLAVQDVQVADELHIQPELLFKKGGKESMVVPIQSTDIVISSDENNNNNGAVVSSASVLLEIIDEMAAPAESSNNLDIVVQDEENLEAIDADSSGDGKKLSYNGEEFQRMTEEIVLGEGAGKLIMLSAAS